MAETLIQFETPIPAPDGTTYRAYTCGGSMADGLWQGWIEFTPVGGGSTFRPGANDPAESRGHGLLGHRPVACYLEGALRRALEGPIRIPWWKSTTGVR